MGAASVAAVGLNYIFLVAAGRLLGSRDYGTLAALLGLLTVVLLPTGAVQLAVSREVSRRLAVGDDRGANGFGRSVLRLGLISTAPVVALGLAVAIGLKGVLDIESTAVVALTAAAFVSVFALPIGMGVLQGYQRFFAIAALYVLPFALRLGLLALAAFAGLRLGGAVFATVVATVTAAAVALMLIREPMSVARSAPFARPVSPLPRASRSRCARVALLTNIDLLVAEGSVPVGGHG